ncbi:hypothetical protein PE066_00965 [Ramlibacter tataouinensis]|uniref:Rz1-like lysis system protein LysC n=1 Tax=Ramlibacter tataouinensis TaxID=94132 RepID=UPI0022F3C28C|nr:hypothetical protein [Ramlibacter tataouinensis]WBY02140.1 hypothetical protein PE066_00965 [Ramlibacter tataouinensis]
MLVALQPDGIRADERQRVHAEYHAATIAQQERNRELQPAAERRYTVAAEARERVITETITEVRYVTKNLAACPLSLLLSACSTVQPPVPAKIDPPPVALVTACSRPSDLPDGATAQDLAQWAVQVDRGLRVLAVEAGGAGGGVAALTFPA